MSVILGAALGGGMLVVGSIMKSNAKSAVHLHEQAKLNHRALGIDPPRWEEDKAMYEASSKSSHFNANVVLAIGLLVTVATIFN